MLLDPVQIAAGFPHQSTIPNASVCLSDSMHTLSAAGYALHEAYAERIWYGERSTPLKPMEAVFFARFFADDCALRLYAAGEQLADAVVAFLEIGASDLTPYRKKFTSRQATVGAYLAEARPRDGVTNILQRLRGSTGWEQMRHYRDKWVHDQPPIIAGLGLGYGRGNRWSWNQEGWVLALGETEGPRYTIEELLRFVHDGLVAFAATLSAVLDEYEALLASRGVTNWGRVPDS